MKIFYRQAAHQNHAAALPYGLHNFILKKMSVRQDAGGMTKKTHHHTHFELHMIISGHQEYRIDDKNYRLESGEFLLIAPHVSHRIVDSDALSEKYSIIFHAAAETTADCCHGKITQRMQDNMEFIVRESQLRRETSALLIENCILETAITVLRAAGLKEKADVTHLEENAVIELAKQYIIDNIEAAPDVTEVAKYCYLSTKQLTRIFTRFEGISPGEYIKKKRTQRIEQLLQDKTLSLKEISEKMNFSNEYYFNAFFKKQAGMPPGEYRKML